MQLAFIRAALFIEPKKRNLKLRVTSISPGFVQTNLTTSMTDPGVKAQIVERMEKMAIPPAAIARAIAFASSSRLKLM